MSEEDWTEDYNWVLHERRVREFKKEGFSKCPNWFPLPPVDGYEIEMVGGFEPLIKPAPKLIHRIWWQWIPALIPRFIKRWNIRRDFDFYL